MTDNDHNDTYETLIFYAGVMKYLIEGVEELARFQTVQQKMTNEMRNILFMLVSNRIAMKRQKILGIAPVLHPYHRLNPLFYHLSHTEDLYYTIEDVLLIPRLVPQRHSTEYEEFLTKQRDEISSQIARSGKPKGRDTTFEVLSREYNVRENESKRQIFSRTTLNKITHRVLTELTATERTTLMGSQARSDILAVLKLFNERFPDGIREDKFERSSTSVKLSIAPLYNYDMSMEGTLNRAINHTVDYTREFAKLEKLKERLKRNPRDKDASRQHTELSEQVGSPNPFRGLRKKFDEDMSLLSKLSHRKDSDEKLQEARERVETRMKQYAEICENAAVATKQSAVENREKTAIFIDGKA